MDHCLTIYPFRLAIVLSVLPLMVSFYPVGTFKLDLLHMPLHIYTLCNSVSCYIGAVTNDHQYLLLVLKHSLANYYVTARGILKSNTTGATSGAGPSYSSVTLELNSGV